MQDCTFKLYEYSILRARRKLLSSPVKIEVCRRNSVSRVGLESSCLVVGLIVAGLDEIRVKPLPHKTAKNKNWGYRNLITGHQH